VVQLDEPVRNELLRGTLVEVRQLVGTARIA
jgi:hypothetical protein